MATAFTVFLPDWRGTGKRVCRDCLRVIDHLRASAAPLKRRSEAQNGAL